MKNCDKYTRGYFMPPEPCYDWAQKDYIDAPPIWCSVDLRDGNQALIIPMSLEQKLDFFAYLVSLGFKEIEVGFPAASETEYTFLRTLIERNLIPDDVTVQVLTQSREHIIQKTFEALSGVKNAIVHLYNSTSVAQREQVFKKSKEEIVGIAVTGAKLIKKFAAERPESSFRFEYSPESFTGTEPEFALEICNRVLEVFAPSETNKVIVNLPSTVQMSMPHVYASQIEYMSKHLICREHVVLSVHPHNDRGCGVADSEMGILAGADRVEGTLFGNGERTGNADIVTIALNMFAQGVDPGLELSNMAEVRRNYESYTGMTVDPRHPYGGDLVFTAFSGSHQDAIAKGMNWRREHNQPHWNVPYLMIDPMDIGRSYDGDVIRINSQSGKGGIGYLLQEKYGFNLPAKMREDFGYLVKGVSDRKHKELLPEEIREIFYENYVNLNSPLELVDYHFSRGEETVSCQAVFRYAGKEYASTGVGGGRLDAFSDAVQKQLKLSFSDLFYEEHALESGVKAQAAAYVGIAHEGKTYWGAGIDADIMAASVQAFTSAVNKIARAGK